MALSETERRLAPMWILLTDRRLKGFKAYGPFATAEEAQTIADKLTENQRIKSDYSIIPLSSVRIDDDGRLWYEATI
jgi:hypothetical protein